LPEATQTGANIFACRINGNNYIVPDPDGINLGTSYLTSKTRDTLGIGASGVFTDKSNAPIDEIWIQIDTQVVAGNTYRLNNTAKASAYLSYVSFPCGAGGGYGGGAGFFAYDGYVTITRYSGTYSIPSCCDQGNYDANAIIAGTFNFIVAFPHCDTLRVTDGRFDINYSQY